MIIVVLPSFQNAEVPAIYFFHLVSSPYDGKENFGLLDSNLTRPEQRQEEQSTRSGETQKEVVAVHVVDLRWVVYNFFWCDIARDNGRCRRHVDFVAQLLPGVSLFHLGS